MLPILKSDGNVNWEVRPRQRLTGPEAATRRPGRRAWLLSPFIDAADACIWVVGLAHADYKADANSNFPIARPMSAAVRMRRSILFSLALAWCSAVCAAAYASDSTTVDPFLSVAQWAEAPVDEGAEIPISEAGDEPAACGDEVSMTGLIESSQRQWSRWSALVDFPILLPSLDSRAVTTPNDHPVFGPRLSLGWQNAEGLGIRGRAWGFDNSVDVDGQPILAQEYGSYFYPYNIRDQRIVFRGGKFDLDFYKQIDVQAGYLRFGASLTAAQLTARNEFSYQQYAYDFDYDPWSGYYYYNYSAVTAEDADKIRTRGGGLGLLAEGAHRLNHSPIHQWSAFGRGRVAYLVGEQQVVAFFGLSERDANMTVGEAALGLEYRRKFARADLIVQCAFEVQSWDMPLVERVNLIGVTPSVGLNW